MVVCCRMRESALYCVCGRVEVRLILLGSAPTTMSLPIPHSFDSAFIVHDRLQGSRTSVIANMQTTRPQCFDYQTCITPVKLSGQPVKLSWSLSIDWPRNVIACKRQRILLPCLCGTYCARRELLLVRSGQFSWP